MTVQELFSKCGNFRHFRVKIKFESSGYIIFDGEPGEPISDFLLDDEIKYWYLPDRDDCVENLVEICI